MSKFASRVLEILDPFRGAIRQSDVASQSIPFDPARWTRALENEDPRLLPLVKRLQPRVSRADLIDLGGEAITTPDDALAGRRVLVATLMFGWGKLRGLGPRNAERALQDPHLDQALAMMLRSLRAGETEDAYRHLNVAGCGAAYLSKVLYASGRSAGGEYPVILDSAVAATLDRLMGTPIEKTFASVEYSLRRNPRGYAGFVRQMHEWSDSLGCEADQLEMFLWKPSTDLIDAAIAYYD